jgi:hypothetical protein
VITASASVFINRSPEDIFEFASDFESSHLWQEDVIRSEQTSEGPVGVGSTGVFGQKLLGREVENEMEVTAYEPPTRLCFRTTSGPISFEGCQICEAQDGGTLFTLEIEGEVGGFFKLAEGMVQKQVVSSFERDLNNLKSVMEG